MVVRRRFPRLLVVLALCAIPISLDAAAEPDKGKDDKDKKDNKRPSFTVKASPMMAFSPARIFLSADLKGGADDYEEFYCPTVEWDWGDGTHSESTMDCEPYEAGKSEIKRRFVIEHIYRMAGSYKIQVRLKKKDKPVIAANVTVQVRPGFRDPTIGG